MHVGIKMYELKQRSFLQVKYFSTNNICFGYCHKFDCYCDSNIIRVRIIPTNSNSVSIMGTFQYFYIQ